MRVSELAELLAGESPLKVVRIDTGDDSLEIVGVEDIGSCILVTPNHSFYDEDDEDDEDDDEDDEDDDEANAAEEAVAVEVEINQDDKVSRGIKELKDSADIAIAIKAFAEFGRISSNLYETIINKKDKTP